MARDPVLLAAAALLLSCDATREAATTDELNGHPVVPGSGFHRRTVRVADAQGGCTGTLIGDHIVLTAGHCICGGGEDPFTGCVKQATATLFDGTVMGGSAVAFHPDYSMNWAAGGDAYTNDLGAVILISPATKFGAVTAPANTTSRPTDGLLVTLVGYGDQDGTGYCNGGFVSEQFGSTNLDDVDDRAEEGIELTTTGFVHGCHGDSGGPMFNVQTEVIGVMSRAGPDDGGTTISASVFGESRWIDALGHLGNRVKILDIAHGEPPTASVYTDTSPDSMVSGWFDTVDAQVVGDFAKKGYDQLLLVNKGPTANGVAMIADYRDGVGDTEIDYLELLGWTTVLRGWIDPGDRVIGGDFMGEKASQALFVNTDPLARKLGADRLLIGSFYSGTIPMKVRYREPYSASTLLDDMMDADDDVVAGDFRKLGHAQGLFVNRTPGAAAAKQFRIVITDFVTGVPPADLRYEERYGDSPVLDGMTDPGDRVLVGDFMGFGWDQAMFLNTDPKRVKGAPLVRIVDFNTGQDFGKVVYAENVGDRIHLNRMLDAEDVALAGNFMDREIGGKQPAQVMFINNTANEDPDNLYLLVLYFNSGVPDEDSVAYQDSFKNVAKRDPNLSNVADVLLPRFDVSAFVTRAGNFRGRKGTGRGHVQLLSARRN
jgi:Trypsin